MTSPLRRKPRTTARGRSTPIRTLASAVGLGLFLAAGTANAQNWVPATSPYGTWRQPAQAGKPAPNSWRQDAKPATPAADAPSPPPPPAVQQPASPPPVTVVADPPAALLPAKPVTAAEPLPPLPPPPVLTSGKPSAVIPVQRLVEEAPQPAAPPQGAYTIKPAAFQPPLGMADERRGSEELTLEQTIQLTPPGPERIFRLESEAALDERMRQEGKTKIPPEKIAFPEEPVVSTESYPGRHWPPQIEFAEPNYVCYGRLLFEDKNTERYGWDFGILQPVVSTAKFYADVVTLPYHVATAPCRCYECSAGLCLPGDPVPYLCYPPELSATGALGEGAAIAAILAIFP